MTLLDTRLSGSNEGDNQATLRVVRRTIESNATRDGVAISGVIDVYTTLLDHPRYNLVLNIARGTVAGQQPTTSITGLVGHDLPWPNVDFVVFENSYTEEAIDYLPAFERGIQELSKLHFQEGSQALGQVYRKIGSGMRILRTRLEEIVPGTLLPQHNKLVITALPEMMKFTELPPTVNVGLLLVPPKCDCGVSCCCGCSWGCGCSLGICFPPVICGCCCGVGCGAGCGCGTCL